MTRKLGMKRKSHVKREPKRAPKIKTVKLPEAVVLHVEAPPEHVPVPVAVADPDTKRIHVRVMPVPKEKAGGLWEFFFGPERK